MMLREELFRGHDIIATTLEIDKEIQAIGSAELFEDDTIMDTLKMLNESPEAMAVAGSRRLLLHANQAFELPLNSEEIDELDFIVNRLGNIYCKGFLRDITWLGSLSVTGFVARLQAVKVYNQHSPKPRTIHKPLSVPVADIKSYFIAA